MNRGRPAAGRAPCSPPVRPGTRSRPRRRRRRWRWCRPRPGPSPRSRAPRLCPGWPGSGGSSPRACPGRSWRCRTRRSRGGRRGPGRRRSGPRSRPGPRSRGARAPHAASRTLRRSTTSSHSSWERLSCPGLPTLRAPETERRTGYCWRSFIRRARRDLRRAAVFLWIRPLAAAWSIRRCAVRVGFRGRLGIAGLGGGDHRLVAGLELGAHRLVAVVAHLVLAVALDLRLDVGHAATNLCERERRKVTTARPRYNARRLRRGTARPVPQTCSAALPWDP